MIRYVVKIEQLGHGYSYYKDADGFFLTNYIECATRFRSRSAAVKHMAEVLPASGEPNGPTITIERIRDDDDTWTVEEILRNAG